MQVEKNGEVKTLPATFQMYDQNGETFEILVTSLAVAQSLGWAEYVAPVVDPVAEAAQHIRSIQIARRDWLLHELDPDGIVWVREGAILGLPKAAAVDQWARDLAMESYHRQALVENGQFDLSLLDFSTMPKPYTFDELVIERGGL